jgi:hypothetical protein
MGFERAAFVAAQRADYVHGGIEPPQVAVGA